MKLGFVFDTKFIKYNGHYYSTNLHKDFLYKRYLNIFDNMVIIGRAKEVYESPEGKYLRVDSDKIEFKSLPNESPVNRIIHFFRESKYIENILSSCDVVICRGWRGTNICEKLHKPYLIEVVNCAWDAYWNHSWLGKIVAPIIYGIRRYTTKKAPYVMYVTNKFLQKRYPSNGNQIGISDVEINLTDQSVLQRRLEKISNLKDGDKIVIGTAAAVDVSFKGQRFVIKAIGKLKKKGIRNIEYQIAGGGDNRKLKRLAEEKGVSDQIVFLGSIVHEDIFHWFDGLDIYIQPSLQEGLPRALIEAMSRGVPCYGTKTGGIPELLDSKCICSSNRFLSEKFALFIENFDKKDALQQAKRNYNLSKEYYEEVLNEKRNLFLTNFKDTCKKEKKIDDKNTTL